MKDPLLSNKIAAAVLAALLLIFGLPQLTKALYGGGHHGGEAGELHLAYGEDLDLGGASAPAEAVAKVDLGTLLANASAAAGERRAALCKSCHTFDKDGANGTGPNLWNIVGREVAGHAGFNYTNALKEAGGVWTYERLDAFLKNSQEYIPGTAMVQRFPKDAQRADLLAYLGSLSDNPVAFPAPAAPAEEADAATEDHAALEADSAGSKKNSLDDDLALYFEGVEPIPASVEADERVVALGEALYHDPQLSGDGTVSCATCHALATGGVDGLVVSKGIDGKHGTINAPTVYNSEHNFVQFWDGRAATLEEQAAGPVENPVEMGAAWPIVVERIAADENYRAQFNALFNGEVSTETVTKAIAEFERTLVTPNSAFDKYLKGDKDALTETEKRGALLFAESGCTSCHSGSYFGGENYQKLSESYFTARGGEITDADLGRYNVTGDEADRHMFKTPMLRNIAVTAPYFHDGSAADLETAVKTMAKHQLSLDLSDEDASAIAAFLKTLTGEYKGVRLDQMAAR